MLFNAMLKKSSIFIISVISALCCLNSCATECNDECSPKEERLLGYDILDLTENGSFDDNLTKAKSLGLEFMSLHLHWNQIETEKELFSDPYGALRSLNDLAVADNLKFALIISPIDIPGKVTPADLLELQFDSEEMILRFTGLIDYILSIVDPEILTSLSVGNEIDAYNWSGNNDSTAAYTIFLTAIEEYLDSYGVKLAFTGTLGGLTSGTFRDQGIWTAMAAEVDVVHVTYYPMNDNMKVKSPDSAADDLALLVSEFSETTAADGGIIPIFIQEVGYQSSSVCGSSEKKQADFFYYFFLAWDTHRDIIKQASILRLNDVSRAQAEITAETYGLTDNNLFIEYIRTLGLVTYNGTGTDKTAVSVIKTETARRGW